MSLVIYTLQGLGIEEKLKQNGFKKNYIERHACKYHYIIHLLLKKYKRNGRFEDFGFVRLSTSYIKELFGKARFADQPNYPDWVVFRAVRHLEEFGIIECRRYYKAHNSRVLKCKIPNKLFGHDIIRYPDEFIYKGFRNKLYQNKSSTPAKYQPIEKMFRKVRLDKSAAQEKLDEMIDKQYISKRAKRDRFNRVVKPIMDIKKASDWQLMIDNFDKFWFNVAERSGSRAYSNATNFPRDLRCYLYFKGHKGKPLWELDIKNSQPLLLSILVTKHYEEQGLVIPEDVKRYKSLCETGNFVNYFKEELDKAGIKNEETLKIDLFARIFFNKESPLRTYHFKKKFDELFPTIGNWISTMKKSGASNDSYKIISKQLTKIEAEIMIERISLRLIDLGIEFFPIHDAIYTVEDYKQIIRRVIIEEFKRVDVNPTINITEVLPVNLA